MEKVVITIEKLKELCPKCADNAIKKFNSPKNVKISKSDYDWLMMKQDGRPPKDWWDRCVESVSQNESVDDPSALCGYIWQEKGEDEEAKVPDTEDSMEAVKAKMKADECVTKLKKDMEKVMDWRKCGIPLSKEQEAFAERVADEMIALRTSHQAGIQIISKSHVNFIKGMQPVLGSERAGACEQDVVANTGSKSGKFPRKTEEDEDEVIKVAKPSGVKPAEVPISAPTDGNFPRKTPDVQNIKLSEPDNQKEGEVNDTIKDEKIGHQPNEPMPKKMAEELIANANWGVEVGAYTNVKEGIERQLGRKAYAEFIDTDDKMKGVVAYLNSLIKDTEAVPVA